MLPSLALRLSKAVRRETSNVIPETARLMGTCRTFSPTLRERFPKQLERLARGIGEATRTTIEACYHYGTPVMVNDPSVTQTGLAAAAAIFGRDKVITEETRMGGEDFAKYDAPKAMLCLGGGFEDEKRRKAQHNPQFDIDERALPLGVAYFLEYVDEYGRKLDGTAI